MFSYDKIGRRIKMLAEILAGIGIVFCVVIAVIFVVFGFCTLQNDGFWMIICGGAVGFVGSLLSWIFSFLLYGFGELIEQATAMTQRQEETHEALEEVLHLLKERWETTSEAPTTHSPASTPNPGKTVPMTGLDKTFPLRSAEERPMDSSFEEEPDSEKSEPYISNK